MKTIIALAAVLLCARAARASDSADEARAALKDRPSFHKTVASSWDYECPDDAPVRAKHPKIKRDMKLFMEGAVFEGMTKLNALNPELAVYVLSRAIGHRWLLSCEEDPDPVPGSLVGGQQVSFVPEWLMPDNLHLGFVAEWAASNPTPKNEQERQYFSQIVFHEFLHFARLENNSEDRHNNVPQGCQGYFQDDIVYACSTHAFPNGRATAWVRGSQKDLYTTLGKEWISEKEERRLLYTKRACMTCASTRIGMEDASWDDKIRHDASANEKCSDIQEYSVVAAKPQQFKSLADMLKDVGEEIK